MKPGLRRRSFISALVVALAGAAAACSSTAPTNPSPTPPVTVDPGPVVNNTPPVISRFTVQGTRTNEPSNFADVSEDVPVSVEVTDAESAISDLKFNWSSSVGTFRGTGPKVTWRAPDTLDTPTVVTLNLEVVETYISQGKQLTNRTTSATTVSAHDSVKEVGDMARQFLLDFSDSSIKDIPLIMRNFEPNCYGTGDETFQVTQNRVNFQIVGHTIGPAATTVNFGGVCPYNTKRGDACAQVPSYWKSMFIRSFTDDSGVHHSVGELTAVDGTDQVAAMYYREQQRWRLCDSSYKGHYVSTLRPVTLRSLVP